MKYTKLGNTGMTVSRICLGCMSFGSTEWRDWILEEEESLEIIERAIELGINFFDTANAYSRGESERILGKALADCRDEMVVATKGYFRMNPDDPNSGGLSRIALDRQIEGSLDRLNMDTIDLYQIHRWDDTTPIEETLWTLDDAVRGGDIRYIGASSMWAYQFSEALYKSDLIGLDRFVSMQNHYNLVYREEEREMLPLCRKEGIGVIPWSPLARGYLTRPHEDYETTARAKQDDHAQDFVARNEAAQTINGRVNELAEEKGATMAQIALAWLLHKDWVDAPIVGTTSVQHLEEAVEALEIELSEEEVEHLEDPYEPQEVIGHR